MAATTKCTRLLLSAILLLSLRGGEASAAPVRKFPFWASSDGKGMVSLFWLPPNGQWPPGGFRLERIHGKRRIVLVKELRPGRNEKAMAALPPEDANAIRQLADKIRGGTLTDEERSRSISSMGKTAATDAAFGSALGVRYTDRVKGTGKLSYRLIALDAAGKSGDAMESNAVNPRKRTPGPARPVGLAVEEHAEGIVLFWSDPPASVLSPVVAFRVERIAGRGKAEILTDDPLVLNRHLEPDRPQFIDSDPPRDQLVYRVRSIDIFGRVSAPARVGISAENFSPSAGPPLASPSVTKRTEQEGTGAPPATGIGEAARVVKEERIDEVPEPQPISAPPANLPPENTNPVPESGPDTAPDPKPEQVFAIGEKPPPVTGGQAAERAEPMKTEKTVSREDGSPPPPSIVAIAGLGDRVTLTLRPGEPEDQTSRFLVIRSKSPTGPGVLVGHPIPADTRKWEDRSVEAGGYYWYRIVAIGKAGNRSAPSKPRWVAVGSH